jgi:hypothetical protein
VDFDPQTNSAALAAFRARYNIGLSVPIYGPFSGSLANDGETVSLYLPDNPQTAPSPDAGYVPYVIADSVSYTDTAPWPSGAVDGGGYSLQRIAANLYGNEPLNWTQAIPTPGTDNTTVSPDADSDGDGIPDLAETTMGLDPFDPDDASQDSDVDGMTNLEEYLSGTDHLNPNSLLRFDKITNHSPVKLTFQAAANRSYSVLFKNSLTDPSWQKLTDVTPSSVPVTMEITDPYNSGSVRFYHLVTPAQP